MLDDEAGHVLQEGVLAGIGVAQGFHPRRTAQGGRAELFLQRPRFVVDDLEQVEGVEAEVHRAAGGIEHEDGARVFERAVGDVDGLLEQIFLGEVVLLWLLWSGVSGLKENFGGPADEVAALPLESGVPLRHLVPDAAEGVVGEKLDDIARREELVSYGQFATVARRGGFLAHLLAFFLAIEVLIEPADSLVFDPQ